MVDHGPVAAAARSSLKPVSLLELSVHVSLIWVVLRGEALRLVGVAGAPETRAMKWFQSQYCPGSVWVLQVVSMAGKFAAIQVFQVEFCHSLWPMIWLRSLGIL